MSTASPKVRKSRARRGRAMRLTAVYVPDRRGGYSAWIAEAVGVHTQGRSFEQARENLLSVIELMLEEAPGNFGAPTPEPTPPGASLETMFVVFRR